MTDKPKTNHKKKRFMFRVLGTWGVSFFTPLVGANVAETYYNLGMTFEQALMIALIASLLNTGLVLAREAKAYGEE